MGTVLQNLHPSVFPVSYQILSYLNNSSEWMKLDYPLNNFQHLNDLSDMKFV